MYWESPISRHNLSCMLEASMGFFFWPLLGLAALIPLQSTVLGVLFCFWCWESNSQASAFQIGTNAFQIGTNAGYIPGPIPLLSLRQNTWSLQGGEASHFCRVKSLVNWFQARNIMVDRHSTEKLFTSWKSESREGRYGQKYSLPSHVLRNQLGRSA